jgi:hypothetical protein
VYVQCVELIGHALFAHFCKAPLGVGRPEKNLTYHRGQVVRKIFWKGATRIFSILSTWQTADQFRGARFGRHFTSSKKNLKGVSGLNNALVIAAPFYFVIMSL